MNWFKKATITMDPLELDWDAIAFELQEELGREPTSIEIQAELMKKYWNTTDILEKQKPKEDFNELV